MASIRRRGPGFDTPSRQHDLVDRLFARDEAGQGLGQGPRSELGKVAIRSAS